MADTQHTIDLVLNAKNNASKEINSVSKQIEGLGNTLKSLGIAAAIGTIGKKMYDLTTAMEPVENSFYRLSASAGIAGQDMLNAMREATLGTVSDFGLMEQANKAYSLGVVSNIDEMTTLMEIARLKGQAMGRTMEEALGDIVTGLGRSSPMILDNLGIVIKLGEAQEQYAQQIGKTVEQLTEAEKKQALINAVVSEGKKELELAGDTSLTTQERFAQLQAQLQNIAVDIGQTLVPYVNYFLDQINVSVDENTNGIFGAIKRVIEKLAQGFSTVYTIVASVGDLIGGFFGGLRVGIVNGFNKVLNRWIERINMTISQFNSIFGTSIGQIQEKTVYSSEVMAESRALNLGGAVADVEGRRDSLIKAFDEGSKNTQRNVNTTTKSLNDMLNAIKSSGNGGSNKSNSEELKKIQDTYKGICDEVDDAYDNILKLNDERQDGFDELQKNLDDVDKTIENLKDDISGLRGELSQLGKDETSDIATEFVKAKKAMQELEREYGAGIGDVAGKYSLSELENYSKGGIGKYDIDALTEYKRYSDELSSVYAGLNEEERKAMDEQIAYQERYQSLNGIEKIREDYRIKREEIQTELDSKMNALRTEQLKRQEIEKQMADYRKQRLETLNEEIKKRVAMYTEKMDYEKKYMAQLEIDQARQVEMYNELIRKARELAAARSEAGGPGGTRASGGPVYAGNSYLVGENGPELFIPSQNGSITRNEDLKGQEFTINVNMGGVVVNDGQDTEQLADTIARTITRQLELYKKGVK